MALDLFFSPYRPKSRSKSAKRTARQALFDALLAVHAGTRLQGDALQGHIEGFPWGDLHFDPEEIHWSLHHLDDVEPVHAVVDWFFQHGFGCHDPQDAGFDRPMLKPKLEAADLDALVGGQWLGFNFDRNWSTALTFEFTLTDGRDALLRVAHFGTCHIPELSPLVKAVVTSTHVEQHEFFETITVRFDGDHALILANAVFSGVGTRPSNTR